MVSPCTRSHSNFPLIISGWVSFFIKSRYEVGFKAVIRFIVTKILAVYTFAFSMGKNGVYHLRG